MIWIGPEPPDAAPLRETLLDRAFGPARFEPEMRDLRAAVAEWPNEGPREDGLAVLDLYLAGKPLPE